MFYPLILLFIGSALSSENSGAPQFDLLSYEDGYHGIVDEDQTEVEIQPKIRASPNVCSFRISSRYHGDAPFSIHLRDAETGEAELLAKRELNCEKRKNYKFDIVAISCDGIASDNVTVRIKVNDVNEFSPSFAQTSYVAEVEEQLIHDHILTLRAEDQDCSPKYGDICRYELLSDDQPFVIDGDGVLRNTEELSFEKSPNHILSVVAFDCGMKKSLPVMVTIKVTTACRFGWRGIPKQVDYTPGSGKQEIFPVASLDTCDSQCEIKRIQTRVSLTTEHIGKGCDRDTFSVSAQRKICGASEESIDLLPPPGPGREWTSALVSDEGVEGDLMYSFSGDSSGVEIPNNVLSHNFTNSFTLSTWMKHKSHSTDKHLKEHVICGADDHKMNRHHFALFIRNCKLILLLRREYNEVDLNTFQPAEWRWKLPQVCDNEWHHYSIQAKTPSVVLFVDGHIFHPETGDSPEVIDDWPLHPTKGMDIKMSIGACWQGSEGVMRHGLTGYLAGLSLLKGAQENPGVLECLTRCQESLEGPPLELLQPSMDYLKNKDMTQITFEGDNVTNLESLIRKVSYLNMRENPTPGRRPISLSTNVLCLDGRAVKSLPSESFIVVEQTSHPAFILNGTTNYGAEYDGFRQGLRVFPDVVVSMSQTSQGRISEELDECTISLYPPLNFDHEDLDKSESPLMIAITRDGASINGLASLKTYQEAIRGITYSNRKPAYYLNRDFKLRCQRQSVGKFQSNEYVQRVTVIHPQLSVEKVSQVSVPKKSGSSFKTPQINPAHSQVNVHHVGLKQPRVVTTIDASSGSSHATTLIVVVIVGFTMFLLALAAVRVRTGRSKLLQDNAETEMAWDDTALNITVNPMEMTQRQEHNDSDSDDSNYDDSSEDEQVTTKPKELEWDHSTLVNM